MELAGPLSGKASLWLQRLLAVVCVPSLSRVSLHPKCDTDFEVTDPLPNISFPLSRSWAGSISTQTPGFANNSVRMLSTSLLTTSHSLPGLLLGLGEGAILS
jgi:hypothetical protein